MTNETPRPVVVDGEHPRLDWHLDNWTIYVFTGSTRLLRCKTQSHWASGSSDFDQMAAYEVDLKSALATDALIWTPFQVRDGRGRVITYPLGLTELERTSVLHFHINAVWRSNRMNLQEQYSRARLKIGKGLLKRGIP